MFTKPSVSVIEPPVSASMARVAYSDRMRSRSCQRNVASTRCISSMPARRYRCSVCAATCAVSTPIADRRRASSKLNGAVLSKRKPPVSLTRPAYRLVAIDRVSSNGASPSPSPSSPSSRVPLASSTSTWWISVQVEQDRASTQPGSGARRPLTRWWSIASRVSQRASVSSSGPVRSMRWQSTSTTVSGGLAVNAAGAASLTRMSLNPGMSSRPTGGSG